MKSLKMATRSTQRWMPTHKLTCSKPTKILISSLHQKVMVVQLSQLVWHLIQQLELSAVWQVVQVVPVIQPSVTLTMQLKGSVVLVQLSNLQWSMPQLWLQDGASIRTFQINQSTITAILQPTTVVLRLRMCPCIKLWPTPTISQQFTSLIKSVYKKGLVTVKNSVLTLTMFQKNWEFHLVVV